MLQDGTLENETFVFALRAVQEAMSRNFSMIPNKWAHMGLER